MEQKRAEGESSLSWKGKCSRGSALPRWRHPRTGNHLAQREGGHRKATVRAHAHTYLFWGEIMQVGHPWSQTVSPQAKGLCHVGSFLVVFLFPRSRWGFPE